MYCKNCGNSMDPNAAACLNCGCAKGAGLSYCANCGRPVVPGAAACTICGFAIASVGHKSKLVAGLLGILLGGWGVHNFYLGHVGKGIAQIFLNFCCGIGAIWGLIEGILILCGSIRVDAKGNPLRD